MYSLGRRFTLLITSSNCTLHTSPANALLTWQAPRISNHPSPPVSAEWRVGLIVQGGMELSLSRYPHHLSAHREGGDVTESLALLRCNHYFFRWFSVLLSSLICQLSRDQMSYFLRDTGTVLFIVEMLMWNSAWGRAAAGKCQWYFDFPAQTSVVLHSIFNVQHLEMSLSIYCFTHRRLYSKMSILRRNFISVYFHEI